MLSVRDLFVSLKTSRGPSQVVSSLSFDIEPGTIFGLAGESGCGKSLTALAIMGILPQGMTASGRVGFFGEDLLSMEPEKLRRLRGAKLSMVFQEPMTSLNPVLRVGDQVAEAITAHLGVSWKEAQRLAVSLLRDLNIPSPDVRAREYPHQMSGGMRQRVMIAMAIACGPSLLIADEPTTALDVTIEAQILRLIRSLRDTKGMSVLFITHDLGVIAENAESAGIMYAGRLVELAPVKALFEIPSHPYTVGLLDSVPKRRGELLRPIRGTVPKPWDLPQGCSFAPRCDYAIDACSKDEPGLVPVSGSGALNTAAHLARCLRAAEAPWMRKGVIK